MDIQITELKPTYRGIRAFSRATGVPRRTVEKACHGKLREYFLLNANAGQHVIQTEKFLKMYKDGLFD